MCIWLRKSFPVIGTCFYAPVESNILVLPSRSSLMLVISADYQGGFAVLHVRTLLPAHHQTKTLYNWADNESSEQRTRRLSISANKKILHIGRPWLNKCIACGKETSVIQIWIILFWKFFERQIKGMKNVLKGEYKWYGTELIWKKVQERHGF